MPSIFLASILFFAACVLAYAEELKELATWARKPTAPQSLAPVSAAPAPQSMLSSLLKDLDSPDPKRRNRAFEALPQYRSGELTRSLIPMLDGPINDTRDRIADLLLRNGGEDVLEPLHRYFLERDTVEEPVQVSAELKQFPVERARSRKARAPHGGTAETSSAPAKPGVLVSLHRPAMAPAPHANRPVPVVGTRGLLTGDVAFPPEVLSPEEDIRARAMADLPQTGHPHTYDLLCRVAMSDPSATVRGVAAVALGKQGEQEGGLRALATATRDKDPTVRWNACFALGKMGNPEAKRALRFAENDPDGSVRLAARNALEVLGLDPPMSRALDLELSSRS